MEALYDGEMYVVELCGDFWIEDEMWLMKKELAVLWTLRGPAWSGDAAGRQSMEMGVRCLDVRMDSLDGSVFKDFQYK